jgi:RNA polymerase sigma-70 factor (ECF subfamily)
VLLSDVSRLTDEQLAAEAAREGSDGPAFVELVRRYQSTVWRICFRLVGDSHDAQDAAQEVFVRMFNNRARFEARSRYSTWVYGIAVNSCLTLRRGRSRRRRRVVMADVGVLEGSPEAREPISGGELSLDLDQMLDILDEEDRALLILKFAEGYSYEELAGVFDLSESACKMRVSRAKDKLRERFSDPNQR